MKKQIFLENILDKKTPPYSVKISALLARIKSPSPSLFILPETYSLIPQRIFWGIFCIKK
jgi:hypothetical protein